jgi:hypothetical protein
MTPENIKAIKDLLKWTGAWTVIWLLAAVLLAQNFPLWRDDTDPPWPKMSGMNLMTDHRTGCEYVGAGGGITPRVDGSGRHMGCREAAAKR